MKIILKVLTSFILVTVLMFPFGYIAYGAPEGGTQGSIVKVSDDIYVNEGTTIEGDVVTFNGNIYINGTVTGDAVTILGDIIVNGKVQGDAVTVAGKITVGNNGKVSGDTVEALGGIGFNRNRNYNYRYDYTPRRNFFGRIASFAFSLLTTLGLFLLSSLIYAIMPKKIGEMADTIEPNIGKRIGIGILTIIGSPIAMVLLTIALAITIIGLVVVPFAWLAFLGAGLVAIVPVYVYIGKKAASAVGNYSISHYAALAAGIFLLWLVKSIISFGGSYTGWINGIISFVILAIGVGTLIDYIISNRKRKPAYTGYTPNPNGNHGNGYGSNNYPYPDYVPDIKEGNSQETRNSNEENNNNGQI